jgi:hypothetical protein
MRRVYLLTTIFTVLLCNYALGQNSKHSYPNTIEYTYKGNCPYYWITKRVFLNDSIFVESQVYNDSSGAKNEWSRIDTFKKIGKQWYFFYQRQIKPFISEDNFIKRDTISAFGHSYILFPVYKDTLNNKEVFIYKKYSPGALESSGNFYPEIYFDPDFGVVKLKFYATDCDIFYVKILNDKTK